MKIDQSGQNLVRRDRARWCQVPASTLVAENQGICPHLIWSQVVEQLTGIAALAQLVQTCK